MSNPPPPSDGLILLVTPDETTPTEGQRGWGDALQKRATALVEVKIDPQVLERQMTSFLSVVGRLFQQADQQIQSPTGVQLSEVELSIEISAKGANIAHPAPNVKVELKPLLVRHFSAFLPSHLLQCHAFPIVRKLSPSCLKCTMIMARVIALEMTLI